MKTDQPAPHRICLAARTVLEFTFSGDRTLRIPASTRGQVRRCAELESVKASPEPEADQDGAETPGDAETRSAKGFWRFAKGMRAGDDALKAVETMRRAQIAILAEGAEPPLNVAELSAAECAQMLWALMAQHHELDPQLAANVCGAVIVATNEEAA